MKYYKSQSKTMKRLDKNRGINYFYFWGEVLENSIKVEPNVSIEIDECDKQDIETCFNYNYYKSEDEYTFEEISRGEFLTHYNATNDFIKKKI
jgi:hypothetical protein